VAGEPEAEAKKELEDAGFRVEVVRENSSKVKEGLVIGTIPEAGTKVPRGEDVTMRVSSGPALAEVPSVIGLDKGTAATRIRDAGLVPQFQRQESAEPEGQVLNQSPSGGSTVRRNSTVTMVVSGGVGTVVVPNVVGLSRDDAGAELRASNLSVRVVRQTTDDPNEDDQVLEQSPPGGSRLPEGEAVTISVGKFEEPPPTTTTTTTPPPTDTTTP
jgi:serine/threonine-protein kinase